MIDALVSLDRATAEARHEILADRLPEVSTFYGTIRRMDAVAAEVVGESGTLFVPRDDLERQGLAALGQPVAILREALRGGGSYMLPMAAVRLDAPEFEEQPSPWNLAPVREGGFPAASLSGDDDDDDADWLKRALAREPTAVPAAPLRLT